jgi:hypothetical protein
MLVKDNYPSVKKKSQLIFLIDSISISHKYLKKLMVFVNSLPVINR